MRLFQSCLVLVAATVPLQLGMKKAWLLIEDHGSCVMTVEEAVREFCDLKKQRDKNSRQGAKAGSGREIR